MYKLGLATGSNSSFNPHPSPPECTVSDSESSATPKTPLKSFSSPFKWSTGASAEAPRPTPSPAALSSTSAAHSHSNSVPFLSTTHEGTSSASSASHSPALLEPRASALVHQRTTSSPGFSQGALHMAKLANGNIRTFAAKAKRQFSGFSQHVGPSSSSSISGEPSSRTPSPLSRISKSFPSARNRSSSQPLSSRTETASPTGRSKSPSAPADAIFGLKLPRDEAQRHQVFGVPLKDAAKATRLISPDRLEAEHLLISATRSSVDLTDRLRQRVEAKAYLPAVCIRSLEYIEEHVDEEGLYRVSGSHLQVQQLKLLFDAGLQLDLRSLGTSDLDPHSVTGVLKLWLRQLPHSILPAEVETMLDQLLHQELGIAATTKNGLAYTSQAQDGAPRSAHWSVSVPPPDLVDKMAIVFATLSLDRWHLLRELANHLGFLAGHAEKNKMTLDNLRLILSPTMHLSPAMLQILVQQRQHLFNRERAHALATPTSSPTVLDPPQGIKDKGELPNAPAAVASFASQQSNVGATLRAERGFDDLPAQRASNQSVPLPPVANRSAGATSASAATPSSSSARAPSPSASSRNSQSFTRNSGKDHPFWIQRQQSDRSDEASTTRGSRASISTVEFATRRRSRSLSALGELARTQSVADLKPAQQPPALPASADADDSEAEDLVSSASSTSHFTADSSCDGGLGVKRSTSSMSHTLSEESAEVLQATQHKLGDSSKSSSQTPSAVPNLSLSMDNFGSSLLDGETAFPWAEKR